MEKMRIARNLRKQLETEYDMNNCYELAEKLANAGNIQEKRKVSQNSSDFLQTEQPLMLLRYMKWVSLINSWIP